MGNTPFHAMFPNIVGNLKLQNLRVKEDGVILYHRTVEIHPELDDANLAEY